MDMNVLRTFVAVCEYSGFSAAGEKLGYTQSTVSAQIKQLEKELDVVLFDRIRHNVRVTPEGMRVLDYAKQILALNQKMQEELHRKAEVSGLLRLAMANSIRARFFSRDYLEFHRLYPGIKIKIIECGTQQMFDLLRKNEVDIVFTLDSHIYDSEYVICGEAIEKINFVTSADHPILKSRKNAFTLDELTAQPFILTEMGMSYRKLLDQRLAEESLEIIPLFEIGSSDQICQLLTESKGISFLPDFVTKKYVDEGKLSYIPVKDCDISVWTQILTHRNKWISPVMEAFIEYYRDVIS